MNVTVVGSRTLELENVAMHLLQKLAALPIEVKVYLRRPREGEPEAFEVMAFKLCESLSIPVEWRISEPGGRVAVFLRDSQMVKDSDAVIAYFDEDHLMSGGTGHVVECAINEEKPVYAYTYDEKGVRWAAGLEPIEDLAVYSTAIGG